MAKSTKELAKQLGLIRKRPLTSSPLKRKKKCKIGQQFSHLIIIDFESTCWENDKTCPQEIIEFPAVLLNTSTGEIESEFHYYLQPSEKPFLSSFCQELTGITQEQVDNGIPLSLCLRKFSGWLKRLHAEKGIICADDKNLELSETVGNDELKVAALVTWSDWDLGVCLLNETKRKQLLKPPALDRWIDLRITYRKFYSRCPDGLNGALQDLGIIFDGREHSGLDDARNTSRLAWRMICDGCKLGITKTLKTTKTGQIQPVSVPLSALTTGSFTPNQTVLSKSKQPFVIAQDPLVADSPSKIPLSNKSRSTLSMRNPNISMRAVESQKKDLKVSPKPTQMTNNPQSTPSRKLTSQSKQRLESSSFSNQEAFKKSLKNDNSNASSNISRLSSAVTSKSASDYLPAKENPFRIPQISPAGDATINPDTSSAKISLSSREARHTGSSSVMKTGINSKQNPTGSDSNHSVSFTEFKIPENVPLNSIPSKNRCKNSSFTTPSSNHKQSSIMTPSKLSDSFTTFKTPENVPLNSISNKTEVGKNTSFTTLSSNHKQSSLMNSSKHSVSLVSFKTPENVALNSKPNYSFSTPSINQKQITLNKMSNQSVSHTGFKTPQIVPQLKNVSFSSVSTRTPNQQGLSKIPVRSKSFSHSDMKRTPPLCACGRRSKWRLVQNQGPNTGRGFFSCSVYRRNSEDNTSTKGCSFFQWETPHR